MVGVAGFEPTTLCPPDKCATRLRYTPTAHYLVAWPGQGNPLRTSVSPVDELARQDPNARLQVVAFADWVSETGAVELGGA